MARVAWRSDRRGDPSLEPEESDRLPDWDEKPWSVDGSGRRRCGCFPAIFGGRPRFFAAGGVTGSVSPASGFPAAALMVLAVESLLLLLLLTLELLLLLLLALAMMLLMALLLLWLSGEETGLL